MKFSLNTSGQARIVLQGIAYVITRLSDKEFDVTITTTDGRQYNKQLANFDKACGYCNDIRRQLNNQSI